MFRLLPEKPSANETLYLIFLVILASTLILFMVGTPSIEETAWELCNYSAHIVTDTIYPYNMENNRRLPNETPKDNNQNPKEPGSQMYQEPT